MIPPLHSAEGGDMSRGLLGSALLAATMSFASAQAQVPGANQVQAVTLANGLQVIVWPDHDIPNIALFNWVHAGSRNEVPGITGLAHFFEHMMFNGTTTRAQGEFDRVLEANGARCSKSKRIACAISRSSRR
jgi:zinc protease